MRLLHPARSGGSNRVSNENLPKMGIFAVVAGDFSRNSLQVLRFGSSETGAELQKAAKSGPLSPLRGTFSGFQTAWLGREDSNLRMVESKSGTTFNEINAYSEKCAKSNPRCINSLADDSE
jgi:hypothetical protein